jgi:hypothetical protein
VDSLQNDSEWNPLRKDPRFIALANQVKHNVAPFERRTMRLRITKNGKPRNAFIIEDVGTA